MNRRNFLGVLVGAVATIVLPPAATPTPIRVSEEDSTTRSQSELPQNWPPDGFEVLEYIQTNDADYFEFRVRKWRDRKIVASRTLKLCSGTSMSRGIDLTPVIRGMIVDAIEEMKAA